MALSIGVSLGTKIMVAGEPLLVEEVSHATHVMVKFRGKHILITDAERVEISPTVFLSCGLSEERKNDRFSRLAFEAPRSILIHRVGAPCHATT